MHEYGFRVGRSHQYSFDSDVNYVPRTFDNVETYSEASSGGAASSVSASSYRGSSHYGYAPSRDEQHMLDQISMSSAPSAYPAPDPLAQSMIARPPNYPPSPRRLHCEFQAWTGCQEAFGLDEVNLWIRHTEDDHLNRKYPAECLCWYCDDFKFKPQGVADPGLNFEQRMMHIAGHILDGDHFEQRRPDFHLLDHVYEIGLISPEAFQQAKGLGEGPPLSSDFHEPGWRPPKPEPPVVEKARHGQRRRKHHHYYK
ncbi:hypothetical protein CSOJ01_02769 [Colletotrichum sojae]|uniref:Uncharacterized protein n=1 Tax=Colletotrichum sojae TaxID=2175907 RepID=A0A8H6JPX3_9PEZI|nr:hypothetical protein CSOJ01_02769 [Colletotrichum sojae]